MAALCLLVSSCALPADHPDEVDVHSVPGTSAAGSASPTATYPSTADVLDSVRAAQSLQTVPEAVARKLTDYDLINLQPSYDCGSAANPFDAIRYGECVYGDPNGKKLMVVYGDSHSDMWAAALMGVATQAGWRLKIFAKHACPAPELRFRNPETKTPDDKCNEFHANAPAEITGLNPDLVIVTSISTWALEDSSTPTAEQWQQGWADTLAKFAKPGLRMAMVGDLPTWSENGARCLAAHLNAVQECSASTEEATPVHVPAEQAAATAAGVLYIPTIQWICADRCEPVIADKRVYSDDTHLSESYAKYLTGALADALKPVMAG